MSWVTNPIQIKPHEQAVSLYSFTPLVSHFKDSWAQIELMPVAIIAGTLLPYLNARDRRLLKPDEHPDDEDIDEDDAELERIRTMVREWKAEAARHGRPLKLPRSEWHIG